MNPSGIALALKVREQQREEEQRKGGGEEEEEEGVTACTRTYTQRNYHMYMCRVVLVSWSVLLLVSPPYLHLNKKGKTS